MNKIILSGRLTEEPALRVLGEKQLPFARIKIAVPRKRYKEGEATADYFSLSSFGDYAEWAGEYLHAGMKVIAEGEVRNRKYTAKDGSMVYTMDINVTGLELADELH